MDGGKIVCVICCCRVYLADTANREGRRREWREGFHHGNNKKGTLYHDMIQLQAARQTYRNIFSPSSKVFMLRIWGDECTDHPSVVPRTFCWGHFVTCSVKRVGLWMLPNQPNSGIRKNTDTAILSLWTTSVSSAVKLYDTCWEWKGFVFSSVPRQYACITTAELQGSQPLYRRRQSKV